MSCYYFPHIIKSQYKFHPPKYQGISFYWYITNYTTQDNCNQYQCIMGAAFIYKAFKNGTTRSSNEGLMKQIWFVDINKLALCVFHQLAYD